MTWRVAICAAVVVWVVAILAFSAGVQTGREHERGQINEQLLQCELGSGGAGAPPRPPSTQ